MGNTQARGLTQPESLLGDLPDVVYKDSIGGGRFFKSSLCVHDEGGLVVVKTYAKRPDFPDVKPYEDRLVEIREALAGVQAPHVWPTQRVYHSDRAVYLVRQYMFSTLAACASKRPFLTWADKRWLACQVLEGVAQAHEAGVCHGDIKAENVLVTSWEWVLLADFAPYKPALLPADNPADFSFFFDTGGRRKCCLAPERFYDPGPGAPSAASARAAVLTPAMDVFAAGCVLAELFADGQALFDYSQLLAFRRGTYNPYAEMPALRPGLGELVRHMTQVDPAARLSARAYLQMLEREDLAALTIVRPLMADLLTLAPDARAAAVVQSYVGIRDQLEQGKGGSGPAPPPAAGPNLEQQAALDSAPGDRSIGGSTALPGHLNHQQSPAHADTVDPLAEVQALLHRLNAVPDGDGDRSAAATAVVQAASSLPPPRPAWRGDAASNPPSALDEDANEGLVVMAVLLCSVLRGCRLQDMRVRLISLLADCAVRCGDDETRLQRALPYLASAAAEVQAPAVRCAALRAIPLVLASVRTLPAGEVQFFGEYLLPSLSLLPMEEETAVQAEYAEVLGPLAQQARGFLESVQHRGSGSTESEGSKARAAPVPAAINFDYDAARLRAGVERAVHDLLVGPRPEPKLALLPHLMQLAGALGRHDTAKCLLPVLLTLFNRQEWQVRAALYQHLAGVCPSLGPEGVSFVLLPFLERMLLDPEPDAVAEAAGLMASLCSLGLLRQRHVLAATRSLCEARLLHARSTAVRAAAVRFLSAAAAQLAPAAVQALLMPLVLPSLVHEPLSLQAPESLVKALGTENTLQPGLGGQTCQRATPPARAEALPASPRPTQAAPPSSSYRIAIDGELLGGGASCLSTALRQVGRPSADAGCEAARSGGPHPGAAPLLAGAQRSVALPADFGDALLRSQLAVSHALGAQGLHAHLPPRQATTAVQPEGSESTGGAATLGRLPPPAPWYPRGVAVAHLAEHKKLITRLAASPSAPFAISASADGTAKVWDCRRLERDISFRSRLTYAAHAGPVTAATILADAERVATGSSVGGLHVWRVERAAAGRGPPAPGERYGGIVGEREIDPGQGAVMDLAGWGADVVVAAMQRGPVAGWDLRARAGHASAAAWSLHVLPSHGTVSRFCCDPGNGHNWVVTGTSRGQMCLWDLRFLLPVNSWRHPAGAAVNAMALATATSARLGLHQGTSAAGPLVFVAAGEREVALWDVGDGSCKEVLRVLRRGAPEAEHRQPPAALAAQPVVPRAVDVMGRAKQLGIAELQSPQQRKEGFRALLPTPGGQLLTGGTDRAIRCWDCERPQHSYMVAAPPPTLAVPSTETGGQGASPTLTLRCTYAVRSVGGVPVVEETSSMERGGGDHDRLVTRLAWEQHAAALCHEQSIVDVVQVQGAGEPLLVTAGLDGVVKAWR